MALTATPAKGTDAGDAYRQKVQALNKKIFSATNLDEILIDLKDDILNLFEAERITIYFVDGVKRELVSRFKTGTEIEEIRVPLAPNSVAGYAAFKQTLVNIADVYDQRELAKLDGSLQYDDRWDKRTLLIALSMLNAASMAAFSTKCNACW